MGQLSQRDITAAVRALEAIGSGDFDRIELVRRGLAELPKLVASELTTLSVCDLISGRRTVVSDLPKAISPTDAECFNRFFHVHPLVRYHATHRNGRSHRISDSLTTREFHHTELYNEYYRRIGIDNAMAMPLYVDDRMLVSFVFNRTRRDFSVRDRELLDMLRVPLAALYRSALLIERATNLAARSPVPLLPPWDQDAKRLRQATLTVREREVLTWVGAGKINADIATLLSTSRRTVEKHLEHIFVKLGVETRTAAVMRAWSGEVNLDFGQQKTARRRFDPNIW